MRETGDLLKKRKGQGGAPVWVVTWLVQPRRGGVKLPGWWAVGVSSPLHLPPLSILVAILSAGHKQPDKTAIRISQTSPGELQKVATKEQFKYSATLQPACLQGPSQPYQQSNAKQRRQRREGGRVREVGGEVW